METVVYVNFQQSSQLFILIFAQTRCGVEHLSPSILGDMSLPDKSLWQKPCWCVNNFLVASFVVLFLSSWTSVEPRCFCGLSWFLLLHAVFARDPRVTLPLIWKQEQKCRNVISLPIMPSHWVPVYLHASFVVMCVHTKEEYEQGCRWHVTCFAEGLFLPAVSLQWELPGQLQWKAHGPVRPWPQHVFESKTRDRNAERRAAKALPLPAAHRGSTHCHCREMSLEGKKPSPSEVSGHCSVLPPGIFSFS